MADKLINKQFETANGSLSIYTTANEIVIETEKTDNNTRRSLIISKPDPANTQAAHDIFLQFGSEANGLVRIPVPDDVFKRALQVIMAQVTNRLV